MNLAFLPIVERELRAAVRRKATYIIRSLGTVIALLLAGWLLASMSRSAMPGMIGAQLFRTLTELAFLGCLLAGVVLTADSISEEKREGTIGFLFLAPLQPHDIVAGKLIGTSLNSAYALIAILPVMAIPLLLGGVTGGELARTAIVLLNTLFLSLAAGLLVSSGSRQSERAMLGTLALVLGVTYILRFAPLLHWFSPRMLYTASFDRSFTAAPDQFFNALLIQHLLGWGLIIAASRVTARTWRASPILPAKHPVIPSSVSATPTQTNLPLRQDEPADWLAKRNRQSVWIWISLPLVSAVWMGAASGTAALLPRSFLLVAASLHITVQFWIAWEAALRLNSDRRTGALELLFSTPLSPEEIVQAHWSSLRKQFTGPITTVLAGDLTLALIACRTRAWSGDAISEFLTVMLAMIFLFITNSIALGWTGLWLGLISRNTSRAMVGGLLRIIVLPTAIFMFAIFVFWTTALARGDGSSMAAALWVVSSGMVSYLFYEKSRRHLLSEECRHLACDTAAAGPALLKAASA